MLLGIIQLHIQIPVLSLNTHHQNVSKIKILQIKADDTQSIKSANFVGRRSLIQ